MADGVNIATLALQVDNAQGVAALKQFGDVSEQTAARSTAASSKITTDTMRNARMVAEAGRAQNIALRENAAAAGTLTAGQRALAAAMAEQAAATSASTVAITANAAATTEMAVASGTRAVTGLGRLTYSFGALDSRMLGMSSIAGRMGAIFGRLGVGVGPTIAIMAGIAVVDGLWKLFFDHMDEGAKRVEDSLKKMRDAAVSAQLAMGDLQLAKAKSEVIDAQANVKKFAPMNIDAKTGLDMNAASRVAAKKALDDANSDLLLTGQNKQGKAYQTAGDALHYETEHLALLIKTHNATHDEQQRAIALYRDDLKKIADLGKSQTDNVRRDQLIAESTTLKDALYPKEHKHAGKKPSFLDPITVGSVAIKSAVEHNIQWYDKEVAAADKAIAARAKFLGTSSLKSGAVNDIRNTPDPFEDLINRAHILQIVADTTNAKRLSQHKSALGPGSELTDVKKQAIDMGQAMERAVLGSNLPLREQIKLLDEIQRKLKEIGDSAKSAKPDKTIDKVIGGMRSGADAANLFGGPRGAQWGNILNTAANATENVGAAIAQGGTNPVADAQAALSVASLAKQIFGLGSQSHETKDRINAANNALRDTMSIESDILNHNPLQALLDQAKQGYDQLYASINATLPGLKNQALRTVDLGIALDQFNQKTVLAQQQFALDQSDFHLSMQARKDAAMGLNFDAAKLNLQIQQANEMFAVDNKYGKDSIEAQTLATVQNSEMLRLVNQSLTQLSNAPTGFFAESYASSFVTRQPMPTSGGSTSGSGGGGTTVSGPITINVPAGNDPAETARHVVKAIRNIGNSTVGINGTVAQAMEYM